MDTITVNNYPVTEEEFKKFVRCRVAPMFDDFGSCLREFFAEIQKPEGTKQSLYLKERDLFLNLKLKIILPNLAKYKAMWVESDVSFSEVLSKAEPLIQNLYSELPTSLQLREISGLLMEICDADTYIACVGSKNTEKEYCFKVSNNRSFQKVPGHSTLVIPVVNLNYTTLDELLMRYLIPFNMCPSGLSEDANFFFSDLIQLYKKFGDKMFNSELLIDTYFENPDDELFRSLHWKLVDVLRHYYEKKYIGEGVMDKEVLLNCEKVRADIDPYEDRLLTDPNRGHWDLWLGADNSRYTIMLADNMVARNPLCDINENGVIAIDFGTKSTVVVYQSDIEHSLPMGIGDGNLSKGPSEKRYENPTVMHFVNLKEFLAAYESRAGRPKTRWQDLTISHTAMDQFSNSKSEEYYEYLHQIKQWAGQREKQFRIQSHEGDTYVLPAFLDLDEKDWNPIEIYAYYIGLYINNMRKGHGIFLDYYLSFPVTYETKIREKIVRSFERGLKKSLPASIVENEEVMKRFHVNGEISEPAAYAVCALQEYAFEPEDDEEIFYGIFDFGGGTTDFDFGLWKQSSKRRYDYAMENFGAGGDEYLGGENLLEMLAFEVFKENQTVMREKGFTFTLAPKCTEFLGSDSLLADSQEAEKNMHNLMERIRPYWEVQDVQGEDEEDEVAETDEIIRESEAQDDNIRFVVTLFDKEGKDHPNETLYFSKMRLNRLIEERIREGVNNFFSALTLSYQNEKVKKPATVNILLAGNSCKSPVVEKIFEEAIVEQELQIKEKYNITGDVGKLFEIFPPLGTEAAYKKMESRGLAVCRDDFEKPTGKTGVAFGLIQCRSGGIIERITNIGLGDEIPFQYFIGWRSKKKFVLFKDESKVTKYRGKPDYNIWYKFIEADDSVFDLYYTTLPECVSGELLVDGNAAVKRVRCDVDVVDEAAFVYIRAIDPHTLEYVVAKDDEVENSMLGSISRKEL